MERKCKNTRAKGAAFERNVRDFLRKLRYYTVRQAASSFPDLIAVSSEGKPIAVECKCSKGGLSKAERIALLELAKNYKYEVYFAYPRFSPYSKKANNIAMERVVEE